MAMEPIKATPQVLQKVVDNLIKGSGDARGSYLYKGFRLQISTYKATGAERTSRLYHKRRTLGLCIRCGKKVDGRNPKTGKLYRLCDEHRTMIDSKTDSKKTAKTQTVKTGAKGSRKSR
jgi:hypothetical protein